MKKFFIIFLMMVAGTVSSARANWQYPASYYRDCWSGDDGMRFVMSVRGGAALGHATIKNEIGGLTTPYLVNEVTGDVVTQAWFNAMYPGVTNPADEGYVSGDGRLGDLPAANDYSVVSSFAGFSAGFTMPEAPQWRMEFGFDHISEADYNQNPLFDGNLDLELSSGYVVPVQVQSGGVQSVVSSDVYSIMGFYDFFEGIRKPLQTAIPYVGFGVGYADTKTILNLTDPYGDLSSVYPLREFGEVDDVSNIIQFYKSETRSSNLAPMVAVGFSYGVSDKAFLDFGLRAMYLPKVKWQLTNAAASANDEKHRDWFSAENMLYLNASIGLRVEF